MSSSEEQTQDRAPQCAFVVEPEEKPQKIHQSRLRKGWRCPRLSDGEHNGHPLCIFHLPLDYKSSEDIQKALKNNITNDDPRARRLVGAKLPGINLSQEILSSNDNTPIDLRHTYIAGDVRLANTTISNGRGESPDVA